jgi:hypothetical protein
MSIEVARIAVRPVIKKTAKSAKQFNKLVTRATRMIVKSPKSTVRASFKAVILNGKPGKGTRSYAWDIVLNQKPKLPPQ